MAETCVRSIRATAPGAEILAAIDADPDTYAALSPLVDVVLYSETRRGPIRAWNDALAEATGDPLVLAADDLLFRPGWAQAALRELDQFDGGWGFVGFNDGSYGPEISTHFLVSHRLIDTAFGGVIAFDEGGDADATDVVANDLARKAGRYSWCAQAHVDHLQCSRS